MTTICSLDELSRDPDKLYDCLQVGDMILTDCGLTHAVVMGLRGYDEDTALAVLREALQEARNKLALRGRYDEVRGDRFKFLSTEDLEAEIYASRHAHELKQTA